jgi:hypothetical protein
VDKSFAVGGGFNSPVEAVAADAEGRVLCGGRFGSYQGQPTQYLARLQPDGSLDVAFSQAPRPDAAVQFVIPLADGRTLIGGEFLEVGDTPRRHLAWLLPDGTLDASVTADVEGDSPRCPAWGSSVGCGRSRRSRASHVATSHASPSPMASSIRISSRAQAQFGADRPGVAPRRPTAARRAMVISCRRTAGFRSFA